MHVRYTETILVVMLAGLACLCAHAQSAAQTPAEMNPLGLAMTRQHAENFEPGRPLEVAVTISAAAAGQITAMGLRETLPAEWRLEAVAGASGAPPDISPAPGATNLLEFAWITMPQFPYTFTYVVTPPEGDGGNKVVHGALEYRQMTGAHYAAPVMTEVRGPEPKPPTITLKGANPATLTAGETWQEPGYTAVDGKNRDITGQVVVSGAVDTATAGEYALNYAVSTDDGQNTAATRTVVVKESDGKQTPPATGGTGAASPPEPGATGRELSNPIAASADKNPANTAKPAAKTNAEAGTAIKKPDLPDLSAFRPPVTPPPGSSTAAPPGAAATASPPAGTTVKLPAVQHRAPVPEALKAAAMKEGANGTATAAHNGAQGTSFTTPTAAPRTTPLTEADPSASTRALVYAAIALSLLAGLGLLGWRLVYSRPVRRKPPPKPPVR